MRLYVAVMVAAVVSLVAVVFGLWWAPFPVCAALGAFAPRARIAIPAGAAIGLVAWLGPLAAVNIRFGAGPTATSLAAIMGFGHEAVIPVVLTLLVGTLLGLTGAWLGSSGRMLVAPRARVDAVRNG